MNFTSTLGNLNETKPNPVLHPSVPALGPRLAMKTGEMMMASAQVIGHRTRRMAAAGSKPNASDRREFALMGQEKIEAAAKSAHGMAAHMMTMDPFLGARAVQQSLAAATAMMSLAGSRTVSQALARQARLVRTMTGSAGTARTALRCGRPARPARARADSRTSDGEREAVGQTPAANSGLLHLAMDGLTMAAVVTVGHQIGGTRASSPEQT